MSNPWNQDDPVGEPVLPGTREQQARAVQPTAPPSQATMPGPFQDLFNEITAIEAEHLMEPGTLTARLGPKHLATQQWIQEHLPLVNTARAMGMSDAEILDFLQRRERGGRRVGSGTEPVGG